MDIRQTIIAGLRKNLIPGLILQAFALLILLLYFFVPATKPVFMWFGALKQTYGFAYSFLATALFGGLIPFLYLLCGRLIDPARHALGVLCFYTIFWGLKGIEVDFFYQLQGKWFGYANDVQTIVIKTCIDQFIYTTLWAAPTATLAYIWLSYGYSMRDCWYALDRHFFCVKFPAIVISNWLVWIPAVSIIYTMPNELQIPLFNLVLCFWVLLLEVLNRKVPTTPSVNEGG